MSSRHKSSHENAKADKATIKANYQPPPIENLKYKIIDDRFHCIYYYRIKRKFLKNLRKFSRLPDFQERFRTIPNYE